MLRFRNLIATLAIAAAATPAAALEVTGGFTGWWAQPEQQNHGVIITISRLPGGEKTGVVYWAHFDGGEPSWLIAQGEIDGDTIDADAFRFEDIAFMQPNNRDADFGEQVGTLRVEFADCRSGTVTYETETLGAGAFDISRLDNPPGRNCTGGMADDRRPNRERERIEVALEGDGTGVAELDMRPGRAWFEVTVRDVAPGDYRLQVGAEGEDVEPRGEFEVFETAGGGTRGEIEFRSPRTGSGDLLDFDPRGQPVEVVGDSGVVLSATLPEEGTFPGNGSAPFSHGFHGAGGRDIEFRLDNLSSDYPDAIATAELTMGGGVMEFEIELVGVPAGSYPVAVAGVERGVIDVAEAGSGTTRGQIEFGYPGDAGQRPFDFDPADALIEVFGDAADAPVLFEGTFPAFDRMGGGMGDGPGGGMGDGPGGGMGGDGAGGGFVDVDETSVEFDNVGGEAHAGARAFAEYVARANRTSFEVEVESMPPDSYALRVDGQQRGVIDVFEDGDGELEFGDPPRFDEQALDFDPLGSTLEIADGDEVVFSVTFPQ